MLKTFLRRCTAVALIAVLLSFNTLAQNGKYTVVRFAKNKSSKTMAGKLRNTDEVNHFELNAKNGQTMQVRLTGGGNAKFSIYIKGTTNTLEEASGVRSWSGELTDGGAYVITVYSQRGAVNYSLNVSIR
jgi:hypothetical protein